VDDAVTGLLLALSALTIWLVPVHAPWLLILVLSRTIRPWSEAMVSARGTGLRPVLVWVVLALVLSIIAQLAAVAEPISTGRPWAGRITYLAVLATLAALTSVLNARAPGGRVWAGLMVMLVMVFLIPWLEGPWRLRRAHGLELLHLDAPWTIFYGFVVLVGVTNYLPTRFGASASWLALGFILEYLGLTRDSWPVERRAALWCWVPWTMAASVAAAHSAARRAPSGRTRLERLWFWFRDLWGVVWAIRIQDQFNRIAELKAWPIRLSWFGMVPAEEASPVEPLATSDPPDAEATFRGLVRRFAESERLEEVAGTTSDRDDATLS
jgi:hypothetical protein